MRTSESQRPDRVAVASRSVVRPRRMLAVAALASSAALLAACASPGAAPSTAPPQPTSAAGTAGAEPVALGDELFQTEGLFEQVSDDGYAVRWLEVGASVAVVIGGSGGGGGCIPQPHAAEQGDTGVVVRFDPPDPAIACNADFRLHGWELGLDSPVDPNESLPVQLVNLRGEDETTEVEIGPDDIFVTGPTADPQPSIIDGTPPEGAGTPTPLPDELLPSLMDDTLALTDDPAVGARWIDPGARLAVFYFGSGAAHCVPAPVAARSTSPATVEVTFEYTPDERDCSADGHLYGWEFTLAEPVTGILPVEVTVSGASPQGSTAVFTVQPDDLLGAP